MAVKLQALRNGQRQQRDDASAPSGVDALAGPMPWPAAGPVGGEVRVNDFTAGAQTNPAVATLSNGTFVVAWTSSGQDGSGEGVYAQRFAANGTLAGAEFRVATTTADDQRTPAVTALSGGGFVITWETRVGGADGYDVNGQCYDAAGTAQGSEFLINQTIASFQGKSAVAGLPGGGFVVTWQSIAGESTEIYARRFNADGSPAGAEFRVNSFTTGEQEEPAVAVLAGGGFVVTWQSENQDGSSRGVYGQLYNAAGSPVGGEFRANTTTANVQGLPSVTALEGGGFVIVWGGVAVRGQIYAANGTPVGSEIPIADGFNGVSVTGLKGGGFAVSWNELSSGGSGDGAGFGVVARAFNASGAALGDIVVVNQTTAGDQQTGGPGSLDQLTDGSIALVWAGNGTGDSSGVFLRRFELGGDVAGPGPIVGTSGNDTLPGTTGDDVIRGLGGNDSIDGLGGNDIAEYRGLRSDYRVTLNNGVYMIDDQRDGSPDGTDALTNVEYLRFSGGVTVAIADAVAPTVAPGATPLTGATLINATPEPSAIFPMTVALGGGGYAVVWLGDFAVQNNPATLRGRAFNAAGQPVGVEFTVGDMDFLSEEQVPSLTALAGGGFAVTWMSPSTDLFDQYQDLQVQIYNSAGAAGPRINAGSTGRFSTPVLVGTADGGFLLIRDPENGMDNYSTTGQFFNSAGTATGNAFPVAANVGDHLSAAILSNGDIVMAWNEPAQTLGERAYVRLFSPTGQPRGDSFIADPAQAPGQNVPSLAALAGGGFVMTWFHNNPDNDIYARIFDAAGHPVTATFTVNENTAGTQWYGYVEALDDGGFVVSWTGADGSSDGIFARIFNASGQPRGGEFMINPYVTGNQEGEIRNLAQLANGDLIFSWTGPGADGPGVFTRRYDLVSGTAPGQPTAGPDALNGTASADTIDGLAGNDVIRGLGGNDVLRGGLGNDMLDGGAGTDRLEGGAGDDRFYVDNVLDRVIEASGGGNDIILSAVSYVLADGVFVESIATTNNAGTAAINLTGNSLANSMSGNAGANILNGGAGADVMQGFAGNDRYYVDNALDRVVEVSGGGTDIVLTSVSYVLAESANVESLATTNLAGTGAINLTGNSLANNMSGNAGANILNGGGGNDAIQALGGNDILNGGAGADAMDGGAGDDRFYIDNVSDRVIEASGGGNDILLASVSYVLAESAFVESLATTDNAGTASINLTGNSLANGMSGNAGANILNGGGGADIMQGLGGNDRYYVDNALDRVIEGSGGGSDLLLAAVSYTVSDSVFVEALATTNAAGTTAINLTGNSLDNAITGNAGANSLTGNGGNDSLIGLGGNDILQGGLGNDSLFGGLGADSLTGGTGADLFRFDSALGAGNIDTITDFTVVDDTILLENAVFTGLAAGALAPGAFTTGSAAADASDRIIYNNMTGALLFDADGVGGVAAVQFATLQTGLALTAADFIVV